MKNNRIILLMLVLAISVGVFTGCTEKAVEVTGEVIDKQVKEEPSKDYGITINEDTVSFIDGTGEEINVNKNPQRTVVLFASYLDLWTRNGGKLVGMVEDKSGVVIPGTQGVETVGTTGSISLEKIISLEPDLVILSSNSRGQVELIPTLNENDIQVIAIDYKLQDDYYKVVRLFSAINNREDLYELNAVAVNKDVQTIIEKAPENNSPKVFIMSATEKGLTSLGSNTTVGEMLADLNTVNIADAPNDLLDDKNFSMEKIIEENPDFIFVQTMGSDEAKIIERIKADAESNPAWASLTAVKNDRYIFLPKDLYTYKANHRYAEAYENLAKILYPEVFE